MKTASRNATPLRLSSHDARVNCAVSAVGAVSQSGRPLRGKKRKIDEAGFVDLHYDEAMDESELDEEKSMPADGNGTGVAGSGKGSGSGGKGVPQLALAVCTSLRYVLVCCRGEADCEASYAPEQRSDQ